ncbi:hypothetical protein NE237_023489 [Protea cynaroides]|uniref:Uncharacterized protein n=1 Tax=Protea cynaroides TaxID=273540 RepID=A0A9Q0HF57_9MAGN|nr:hypothetical protein NE237_023489 [Protea cynaroides]
MKHVAGSKAVVNRFDIGDIGICYGMQGNDLPDATQVVSLYKRSGFQKMRLFNPDRKALEALRGSQIQVTLDVPNEDLPNLAKSVDDAQSWFTTNVEPYINDIEFPYIIVGNQAFPGLEFGHYVVPAMQNIKIVLLHRNLYGIEVTTAVNTAVLLDTSNPPSAGAFTKETASGLPDILKFLSNYGASIMLNVYPYLAYAANPTQVGLEYALFTSIRTVVQDGDLSYWNLYDAIVDAFIWSMEKIGFPNVTIMISETGWPSAGNGNFTTPEHAGVYTRNFVLHITNSTGTPKRPNKYTDAHIYAIFNENLKPNGIDQHYGLFYPNMKPVYPLF